MYSIQWLYIQYIYNWPAVFAYNDIVRWWNNDSSTLWCIYNKYTVKDFCSLKALNIVWIYWQHQCIVSVWSSPISEFPQRHILSVLSKQSGFYLGFSSYVASFLPFYRLKFHWCPSPLTCDVLPALAAADPRCSRLVHVKVCGAARPILIEDGTLVSWLW